MFNKRELDKIKAALPPDGYQLIANVLGCTATSVRMALLTPKRCKGRQDIALAIVQVVSEYRESKKQIVNQVMEVIK